MDNVKYTGLKKLNDFEIAKLQDLIGRGCKKLFKPKHKLENALLHINIKTKNVEGNRKFYEIILKLISPSTKKGLFDAKHQDWELERAVHRAFNNLINLIQHKLKVKRGGSYKKA